MVLTQTAMLNRSRRMVRVGEQRRGIAAVSAALCIVTLIIGSFGLMGCSSGGTYPIDPEDVAGNIPPVETFFGPEATAVVAGQTVSVGRSFAQIQGGEPVAIGFELREGAIDDLPNPPFDQPGVYISPLPQQVFALVPFRAFAMSDWSGHSPVGIGDVPHVHPVALLQPPQPNAPPFDPERTPVAPAEVPAGYIPATQVPAVGNGAIAPGIGIAYEYPAAPQLQPGWNTIATNYFFYNGHMNGIGMGATYDFLRSRASASLDIAQPQVYPRAGWYPTRNSVTYDPVKRVHVFKLDNFVRAQNVL